MTGASERPHPVGGKDYPRSLPEFIEWFPDDAACRRYLGRLRWRDGFFCPRCGHVEAWETNSKRPRLVCTRCQRQVSPTAGTIFDKTRTPLRQWFFAIWLVMSQKNGMSALGLQRELGLASYDTAWLMLHKLRKAMVRPDRDKLKGVVEVDETYVGGPDEEDEEGPAKPGRGSRKKVKVMIAVERFPSKRGVPALGRTRMRIVPNVKAETLLDFITDVVEPGSVIYTDASNAYSRLPDYGYEHVCINVSKSGEQANKLLPGVHRLASLLKRWLLGTHHGSVQKWHLDYYLDEFTFRFNRRTSRKRGLLFYRLLEGAVATPPLTYGAVHARGAVERAKRRARKAALAA